MIESLLTAEFYLSHRGFSSRFIFKYMTKQRELVESSLDASKEE